MIVDKEASSVDVGYLALHSLAYSGSHLPHQSNISLASTSSTLSIPDLAVDNILIPRQSYPENFKAELAP